MFMWNWTKTDKKLLILDLIEILLSLSGFGLILLFAFFLRLIKFIGDNNVELAYITQN
jgi:hypothetical protein